MQKIYLRLEKKFVEVRNLKNVQTRHKDFKFFVHKAYNEEKLYRVTESLSGCCLPVQYPSVKEAAKQATAWLNKKSKREIVRAVNRVLEIQAKDRMESEKEEN